MSRGARNGTAYTRLAAQVAAAGKVCSLCGKPMNQTGNNGRRLYIYPHPMSAVADHKVSIHAGGSLMDPANLQPAHKICNERKGDGMRTPQGPRHSRDW